MHLLCHYSESEPPCACFLCGYAWTYAAPVFVWNSSGSTLTKKKNHPKKPQSTPPKPSWSRSQAPPVLRWRGSCLMTMALTLSYLTASALWIDWLGSRFCKGEGSSCPLWHAGHGVSKELNRLWGFLVRTAPRCAMLMSCVCVCVFPPPPSVPWEGGRGWVLIRNACTGTAIASLPLLNLDITAD